MISIKCPYCRVRLKIDESKIPAHLNAFNCPRCKKPISVSLLHQYKIVSDNEETQYIQKSNNTKATLTVLADACTPSQSFQLRTGINIIGRKNGNTSEAKIEIETNDKLMSREHIKIEVVQYNNAEYNYLLSDYDSKNQTRHNSHYLETGEIIVLRNKDEIEIGNTKIQFIK
ncbi:hypothetical protein A9168_02275 [Macellibacteroides sp. HH-ZS]|nr:hypothetical protein A9168_02275 [Macellibacteroides sp. HH-ZS]